MPNEPVLLEILQILLAAEPAIVTAMHRLLTGIGTADDIAILKGDSLAWQALADRAQEELTKLNPPTATSA